MPKLAVLALFAGSGLGRLRSIIGLRTRLGMAVTTDWGHHGSVDGELSPAPKRKPVGDHFDLTAVVSGDPLQVHSAQQNVFGHACSSLATDTSCRNVQRLGTEPEHPARRTC